MTKTKKAEEKQPASDNTPANVFATTLAQLDKGSTLAELSTAITDIVSAVRATGKKGVLKYKLVVKPVPNTDGAQVICLDEVMPDIPKPDRKATLFFTTDDGGLSRKDPNQSEFGFESESERAEKEEANRLKNKITREQLEAAKA